MEDKKFEYVSATQTLVGTRREEYIKVSTGEAILVDEISKRVYGSKNFWKCYLMDFLAVLGIVDNKQLDIFIYIVENTHPANNTFLGTYKKIARDVGVSESTISTIMKKLQANNFIKKIQNGAWLVNPNILMKGNDSKRQILLSYYESNEPINQMSIGRTKKKAISTIDDFIIAESPPPQIEQKLDVVDEKQLTLEENLL
jgi:DNA-binding Lrp family transcriptional regulator